MPGHKKLMERIRRGVVRFFNPDVDIVIDNTLDRRFRHGVVPPPFSRARYEEAMGSNGGIKDVGDVPIDDRFNYQDLPGQAVGFATIQNVFTPPNDSIPGRLVIGAYLWSNSNSPTYWGVNMNQTGWTDPNATEPDEDNNVEFILPMLDGMMGWTPFPGSGIYVPVGQTLNYRTQLLSGHRITATLGLGWRVP